MLELLGSIPSAWVALIGTLSGGVVLALTQHWLGKRKNSNDDARQMREELRSQVTSQKEEINSLEDEVNEWRSKYYDLRDSYMQVKTELQIALDQIKREAEAADKKLGQIPENPPA